MIRLPFWNGQFSEGYVGFREGSETPSPVLFKLLLDSRQDKKMMPTANSKKTNETY